MCSFRKKLPKMCMKTNTLQEEVRIKDNIIIDGILSV